METHNTFPSYTRNPAVLAAFQLYLPLVAVTLGLILLSAWYLRPRLAGTTEATAAAGAIVLETKTMAYASDALVAHSDTLVEQPGALTLRLDNADFLPHTFTIDELAVDLEVAARDKGEVTFTAPPGTYRFYCAIPGHETLGMAGTLTVH